MPDYSTQIIEAFFLTIQPSRISYEATTMAYNEELDRRIQKIVSRWTGTGDKKMFGGVCHLINGNMFCGVHKDFLILRLGENKSGEALTQSFARPFDITGKPMKGWVMVARDGYKDDPDLRAWLEQAKSFAETLPHKTKK